MKAILSQCCKLILNIEGWLYFKDKDKFTDKAL